MRKIEYNEALHNLNSAVIYDGWDKSLHEQEYTLTALIVRKKNGIKYVDAELTHKTNSVAGGVLIVPLIDVKPKQEGGL